MGDHLGSTAYTINGTTKTGEVRYLPFGANRYSSGQTLTSYKFTGQREEAGLGLYFYGARWYDPALGRFVQADTVVPNPGDAQSFDRYAYVNNNPLRYIDPTGHYSDEIIRGNFDCETWTCVEKNFAEGGRYAGLWGWLDILRRAEDGDMVDLYATNSENGAHVSGQFTRVDGKIMIQRPTLTIGTPDGVSNTSIFQYDNSWSDYAFANMAYAYSGGSEHSAFYMNRGKLSTYNVQYSDCQHHDCVTDTLDAASTGSAAIAVGCAAAALAPCTAAATIASTVFSFFGTSWTAYNIVSGNGTALDGAVAVTTLRAGAKANPYGALAISGFQWGWDKFIAPLEGNQ